MKCPQCGSENLRPGRMGIHRHTFLPSGKFKMTGYALDAYVCLDCGQVEQKIKPEDLEKLQKEVQ